MSGERVSLIETPRYSPSWLELREPADAAARATILLEPLRRHVAGDLMLVIRDLGCGTGSMTRWLAPLLAGPQHWILSDRDADLLDEASRQTRDIGVGVTVETVRGDLTDLTATTLAGTSLVTASALLDLLTLDEVDALAAACVEAGCPALLTLSVLGRVRLTPADPLDAEYAAGFADHLRHAVAGGRRLGADAVNATAEAFVRRGATVQWHSSPWRLGPDQAALAAEWLRGWVPAAAAQRPDLAADADSYLRRRLDQAALGELGVTVYHRDLLALPVTS